MSLLPDIAALTILKGCEFGRRLFITAGIPATVDSNINAVRSGIARAPHAAKLGT